MVCHAGEKAADNATNSFLANDMLPRSERWVRCYGQSQIPGPTNQTMRSRVNEIDQVAPLAIALRNADQLDWKGLR